MTGTPAAGLPSRASKDAAKYLLEDEEPVLTKRRHWAVLIEPTAKFVPAFVAGGWLFLLDPENRVTSSVGLVVLVVALGYYGLRVAEWWMRHFIVTRRRVLLTSGVIVRTVTLLPLRRITDLTWQETLLGQLLGYGTFRFESAGQDQALRHLTFMPDAQGLYREVSRLLFSSDYGGAASAGDDEGNPEPPPPRPAPRPEQGRRDTEPIPPLPPRQA
ncbi:MAG: PH domain-containing protein [Actinomycetota bacterium]|nr:PH domain-containing protein [Actinomycetota bacterium]